MFDFRWDQTADSSITMKNQTHSIYEYQRYHMFSLFTYFAKSTKIFFFCFGQSHVVFVLENRQKILPTYFMEGRCRSTTSTACTGLVLMGLSSSRGSGMLRPVRTSWSMCQLTNDTNLMDTLKGRSLPPSPGRVTSRSTCSRQRAGKNKKKKREFERMKEFGECV